jgi:hypothetical protein
VEETVRVLEREGFLYREFMRQKGGTISGIWYRVRGGINTIASFKSSLKRQKQKNRSCLRAALLDVNRSSLFFNPDLRSGSRSIVLLLLLDILDLLLALHLLSKTTHHSPRRLPDDHKRPRGKPDNLLEPDIREQADENSPRQAERRENNRNPPILAVQTLNRESRAANIHNHGLAGNHNHQDGDVKVVALHAGENVELVVQAAVVEHVEDLHPDKGVEDQGADLFTVDLVFEDAGAGVVQDEGYDELEEGLADDHFPHDGGDQGRGALGGLAVEDFFGWRIGGEGKSSHGVPVFNVSLSFEG